MKELKERIDALEIALLLLVNSLRDKKDGVISEIPDRTLDSIEKLVLKNKKL